MTLTRILLTGFFVLVSTNGFASEWRDNAEITRLFASAGATGAFVVFDPASGALTGHDQERARTRFVPASTFKIPNTLIGLARGAVIDVDEVLSFGGGAQAFPQWERDMSLREAIVLSNVPIYRELARRTGLAAMREEVARIGYGNTDIGPVVDRFWLDGPLEISAVEQVHFLARLARDELDYPAALQGAVRDIVLLERRGDVTLYGKTGWQNAPGTGIGWWVGWIERDGVVHAFALNMDMHSMEDAPKRIELGKAALRALGLI